MSGDHHSYIVNDQIDAHSKIDVSYPINTLSTLLKLLFTRREGYPYARVTPASKFQR